MAQSQSAAPGEGNANQPIGDVDVDESLDLEETGFPLELSDSQREAFSMWLNERIGAVLDSTTGLTDADREMVRQYLSDTELEDIIEEWLDAYSDPDNLADLAAQLRTGGPGDSLASDNPTGSDAQSRGGRS